MAIPVSGISHIALCVRDLERSLRFYRDGLGLNVTLDQVQDVTTGQMPHLYRGQHQRRRVVHLTSGDAPTPMPFLVMTEHPGEKVTGEPIMFDEVGISHFSFTV